MYKNVLFILSMTQICLTNIFCQTKCETCFVGLKEHLDSEYQAIVNANKSSEWISGDDLLNLKILKDQYYINNVLAYRLLIEQNWTGSDDSFELVYFSIYQYEFPSYSWAICVFKHRFLNIYNVVTLDVDGALNDRIGSLINSRFFSEFHEELYQEFSIDDNYQSGSYLGFSGLSVFFEAHKIQKVRLLHDIRDLRNLTTASSRIR